MKKWINPFEKNSEKHLIFLGISFFIIGSLMAFFFNSRFDNFLHMAPVESIRLYQPFVDNIIILTCLFIFFLLAGKMIYPKTRAVDILAIILIGNAPFYLMSLTNINDLTTKSTDAILLAMEGAPEDISGFYLLYLTIVGIISLAVLVWIVALLWNGFKTASNAKGIKAVVLFILALIITTVVTYLIPNIY